jgi:NitT/TauT family transport system permease protein
VTLAIRRSPLVVPLGSLILLLLAAVGWQTASQMTFVIPTVPDTLRALVDNLGDPSYLVHLRATLGRIAVACAIGVTIGALVGIVLGYVPALRKALEPLIVSMNSVPKIILYPLLLPIFKIGTTSQVVMGVIHAVFPMLIMITGAVAHQPPIYRRLGRSLEASPWQVLIRFTLPAVRRSLLVGTRLGVSLAAIGVILAEFFSTENGLGQVMKQSYTFAQYPELMSTVLLLLAVTCIVSFAIWTVERRLPEP